MRKALTLLYILLPFIVFGNDIDNLKTNTDVDNFLVKKIDKRYRNLALFIDAKTQNKHDYGHNTFYKADIDHNGLTDLIVDGATVFIVMSKTDGTFDMNRFGGVSTFNKVISISIDSSGPIPKIVLGFIRSVNQGTHTFTSRHDTLVYKFGGFVESRGCSLTDFRFDMLKIKTCACLGRCPVFEMQINADRIAYYKAVEFVDRQGEFTSTIPQDEFYKITGLIEYINPDKLDTFYSVPLTDYPTAATTIFFKGRSVTIRDYGEQGTYGLRALYHIIFSWRNKLEWEEK
jgi:hypothetical protein